MTGQPARYTILASTIILLLQLLGNIMPSNDGQASNRPASPLTSYETLEKLLKLFRPFYFFVRG